MDWPRAGGWGCRPLSREPLTRLRGHDLARGLDELGLARRRSPYFYPAGGNPAAEASRGQVAITKQDFQRVPEVVGAPDLVEAMPPTHQGLPVLRYSKRFNRTVLVVEEVRQKRPGLAFKTLYKRTTATPRAATPDSEAGLAHTSETFGGLDPSMGPEAGQVKPGQGQKALGRAADDWLRPGLAEPGELALPWTPRAPFERPGTISREAAFRELVEAGVLEPGQKLAGYVTHMGASLKAQAAAAEAARLNQTAPELALQPMVPGFARERLDALGAAPGLDQAVSASRRRLLSQNEANPA